ncbi:MAG: acetyl-CoA hydrolase/transferase family protein [Rhizobiaceae bacterium]
MKWNPDITEIAERLPLNPVIVMHSVYAEPVGLGEILARESAVFAGASLHTMMPMGTAPYASAGHLQLNTFLPGAGLRDAVNAGRATLHSRPMSELSAYFTENAIESNVLLLQLSEPDDDGNMSLGISVDYMPTILAKNPLVIAEINPAMPLTFGDTIVREDQVDLAFPASAPPIAMPRLRADEIDKTVARNVLKLLKDGATLQYGIGAIPEAAIDQLDGFTDIGLQTGFITDGALAMMDAGVVTNARKPVDTDKTVTTAAGGSHAFYRALHRDERFLFKATDHTHSQNILSQLDNYFTINSALQVDLAGNVNAERVGGKIISAPGGLPDFARAGVRSKGGASIIALRSTSRRADHSTIVRSFGPETPLTVSPELVTHIVTEYGIAEVAGTSISERAKALRAIAHPDFRSQL